MKEEVKGNNWAYNFAYFVKVTMLKSMTSEVAI